MDARIDGIEVLPQWVRGAYEWAILGRRIEAPVLRATMGVDLEVTCGLLAERAQAEGLPVSANHFMFLAGWLQAAWAVTEPAQASAMNDRLEVAPSLGHRERP